MYTNQNVRNHMCLRFCPEFGFGLGLAWPARSTQENPITHTKQILQNVLLNLEKMACFWNLAEQDLDLAPHISRKRKSIVQQHRTARWTMRGRFCTKVVRIVGN